MQTLFSPEGFIDFFSPHSEIQNMVDTGLKNIALPLNMFCSEGELESLGKKRKKPPRHALVSENPALLKDRTDFFATCCNDNGIGVALVCALHLPIETKRHDLTDLLLRLAEISIDAAESVGCHWVTIYPVAVVVDSAQNIHEANKKYFLRLARYAQTKNITLLMENSCRSYNGHYLRGFCAEPNVAAAYIDSLNQETGAKCFGFSLDVGACNLCGQDMQIMCHTLGERIKNVVLQNTLFGSNRSVMPFGTVSATDWLSLVRGLREINYDGILTMDAKGSFDAIPPLLRPYFLPLMRETADFFVWQIELERVMKRYSRRVLFGAGRMCERYLFCYGQQYPPLFTVDNNEKLWGTRIKGLEIRSPECLRNLPNDCAIFVCNVHYTEIEAQLADMRLTNPILRFNDEYLPAYEIE